MPAHDAITGEHSATGLTGDPLAPVHVTGAPKKANSSLALV